MGARLHAGGVQRAQFFTPSWLFIVGAVVAGGVFGGAALVALLVFGAALQLQLFVFGAAALLQLFVFGAAALGALGIGLHPQLVHLFVLGLAQLLQILLVLPPLLSDPRSPLRRLTAGGLGLRCREHGTSSSFTPGEHAHTR